MEDEMKAGDSEMITREIALPEKGNRVRAKRAYQDQMVVGIVVKIDIDGNFVVKKMSGALTVCNQLMEVL